MYIDNFNGEETKIYTTEELQALDPTIEDVDYFITSGSLYMSLAVNMFKFAGHSQDDAEILNIMRTDPNFYMKYRWTKEQRAEFEHIWTEILMKCLDMDKYDAYHELCIYAFGGGMLFLTDNSNEYFMQYLELVKDLEPVEDDEEEDENKINVINISD